jgi:hypothetical protein
VKWSVSSSLMEDCRRDELTAIRDEIRNQIPWNDASGIKPQTLVVDALSTSGKALASIGSGHE